MVDLLKNYIEKRVELIKLELITVFANIASGLVSSFLILIFTLFILLMFSFSLAFWLADMLDSNAIGFALVGGVYTLFFIVYLLYSKQAIEIKVKDGIVSSALNTEEENHQEP